MDKDEQLSFDFGDTQPVSMDIEEVPYQRPGESDGNNLQEEIPAEIPDSTEENIYEEPAPMPEPEDEPETPVYNAPAASVAQHADEAPPAPQYSAPEKMEKKPSGETTSEKSPFKPKNMKRAILGWLISKTPSGAGINVPTRVSKYCADVAAFWSSPAKKRLMQPDKTVIVEIRRSREQCWPDCSRQEELLPLLIEQKELKKSLETEIRNTEPELKDSDTLFPEYESWRYSESKNKKYRRCLSQIERIEHALYKGSRFEQIRRAHVADYLYLAVPEGTVNPNELADGWGLINIKSDLSAQVVKEAETWDCPIANRLHLAQNIAASGRDALYFSFGVRGDRDGKTCFSPIPKRRRSKRSVKE
jgi:hypothetical protein